MAKVPEPIDVEVGAKIKARRRLLGMSQDRLAEALGITFQQVQKYEKGTNRVSASRMVAIADAFGLTPSYFFPVETADRRPDPPSAAPELVSFIETNEGRDLNVAFAKIASTTTRRKIVGLVTALAAALHANPGDPGI
ncbi:transcriptional regulator with XRE-family HTH domain [Shinella sp. BE166]|uniref:helix-turn-helix domain-containing protein n=1 Tax=Shinella sp. BE166 TaxID=3373918 RepID=UPI003EBD9F6A